MEVSVNVSQITARSSGQLMYSTTADTAATVSATPVAPRQPSAVSGVAVLARRGAAARDRRSTGYRIDLFGIGRGSRGALVGDGVAQVHRHAGRRRWTEDRGEGVARVDVAGCGPTR